MIVYVLSSHYTDGDSVRTLGVRESDPDRVMNILRVAKLVNP